MHAALGEPARLAMAQSLSLGDRPVKELAMELGMPSNLAAHHLAVLEDAGVIARRRSEGDRRRSYVRLRIEDPDVTRLLAVDAIGGDPPSRVVFVCTRNSARSQLAAAAWRRLSRIPSTSAGTDPARRVNRRAVSAARRHHLALSPRATARLADVVEPDDYVVSVCDRAHEELARGDLADVVHWSVPDPVPIDTDAAFEGAYAEVGRRLERLAIALGAPTPHPPEESA